MQTLANQSFQSFGEENVGKLTYPYTTKVSRQKSFVASCTCRPSQKKLPSYCLLNPYLNGAILKLSHKRFRGHAKA